MAQPFRFGIICEQMRSAEELVAKARRAEEEGYATFLSRDHYIREPFGDQFAPLIALMAVASATETLRVGSLVLANDYRHPVMLAKEAATLDLLSGGRFELGIGSGWLREEYEQAGMTFDPAGLRVDRLEETLHVLKGLFAVDPLTFAGAHYHITRLNSYPKPVQQPHPPILVGAGSKRMLMLAGREANIVGILPKALPDGSISADMSERQPATITQKIEWIRQGAGERFHEIQLSMLIQPIFTNDTTRRIEQYIQEREWSDASVEDVLEMPSVFIGSPEEMIDKMQRRREIYGFSYYVVSDAQMGVFAPIVARLAGH